MIPYNGYIRAKQTTGGGFDEDGMPVPVTSVQGEKLDAVIQTNTYSEKGKYQDGRFTTSSYIILLDGTDAFTYERIEVVKDGNSLGEFDIQYTEVLYNVGRVKITV